MNRTPGETRWTLNPDSPAAVADARRAVEAGYRSGLLDGRQYARRMEEVRRAERRLAELN